MNHSVKRYFIAFLVFTFFIEAVNAQTKSAKKIKQVKSTCFHHYVEEDVTKDSVTFPRLSSHLLGYTFKGKALLTTITNYFKHNISMKEWLSLNDRKPNKDILIQSKLVDVSGSVKIVGNTLIFKADKSASQKTFLIEKATDGSISKLIDKLTKEVYLPSICSLVLRF
ncbi:hypothetical protein [Pedobacter frigiditerrae]|uniref:hypothetical protein n=1 Tax=Pedobacter frigiditerrae TaxID=2530452 RepID=UPI0029315E07|nr:hypothetical protein [Pedobacter frigiditerrae]